jgi:transcriptional regulator with XRE-family HTH domain
MDTTFAEWLQVALDERGMSQSDLANAAGIGRGSLSDIVSGRRKVGVELATSIAKGLNIKPDIVFRAAGLLPPARDINEELEQILHEVEQLPKADREEVLAFIRMKSNLRKKK